MKGETETPLDIVITIHNMKLPKDVLKIIVSFAVCIMYCYKCGNTIQKDCNKKSPVGWVVYPDKNEINCLGCSVKFT